MDTLGQFASNEDFISFIDDTEDLLLIEPANKKDSEVGKYSNKRKRAEREDISSGSSSPDEELGEKESKSPGTSDTPTKKKLRTITSPVAGSEKPQSSYLSRKVSDLLSNEVPWLDEAATKNFSKQSIVRLHQEIVQFAKFVMPTQKEHECRLSVLARLKSAIVSLMPNAKVFTFGSFSTDLNLPNSDLDVVIITPEVVGTSRLKSVARHLHRYHLAEFRTIKVISKARVPLVKFTEKLTNFVVDISFNQESGIEGVRYIKGLTQRHPALKFLLYILKLFLKNRGLSEVYTGGLGSYALTLMIASFLKLHPLLQTGLCKEEDNLGVLLLDFFELYGKNFNYEHLGVSVLDSGYFNKEDHGWAFDARPFLLSIEDPLQRDNDVSKSSFAVQSVKQAFQHAHTMLSVLLVEIEEYKKMKNGNLPPYYFTSSFLSAILHIDEKDLHHRYFIEQLDLEDEI